MPSESILQRFRWGNALRVLLSGMCMGACDLVPGISGGTVAFLMGFYPQLLSSLKSLNLGTFKLLLQFHFKAFFQAIAWEFLLSLLIGMAMAMAILAPVFDSILNHEQYRTFLYAGFCGLIVASACFCMRQIKAWGAVDLTILGLGVGLAYLLTGPIPQPKNLEKLYEVRLPISTEVAVHGKKILNYTSSSHSLTHVSLETLSAMAAKQKIDQDTWVYDMHAQRSFQLRELPQVSPRVWFNPWLMGAGMLAISAMLLPGISGSYVLTVLGVYPIAIAALADFVTSLGHLSFDADAFCVLLNLSFGILLGGLLFCRVLSWLLHHYQQRAIAFLTGAMLGASRSIWPFWNFQYYLLPLHLEKGIQLRPNEPFMPEWDSLLFWSSFMIACVTFGCVWGLEWLASHLKAKQSVSVI